MSEIFRLFVLLCLLTFLSVSPKYCSFRYTCPDQPRHMSVAVNTFKYRLPYRDIFGGVSALTKEQFIKVNGFSNQFWGWGGEDDDMSNRIRFHGYKIARYRSEIARYHMITHKKDIASPDRYVFFWSNSFFS